MILDIKKVLEIAALNDLLYLKKGKIEADNLTEENLMEFVRDCIAAHSIQHTILKNT